MRSCAPVRSLSPYAHGMNLSVWSLLERAGALYATSLAVADGDRRLTYGHVARRALRCAAWLRDLGVREGDVVSVVDDNTLALFELYFAAAAAGAILNPINHRLAGEEIAAIVRDAGSRVLLARREREAQVRDVRNSAASPGERGAGERGADERGAGVQVVWLDGEPWADARAALAPPFTPARPGPDAIAHLYYTSGTTGEPRGVMLTHGNVCTHALAAIAELGLSDGDVWGHFAPMFHLADAWATFAITWVGGRHVMLGQFDAAAALATIAAQRVTTTNLVPTMLTAMLAAPELPRTDLSSLRLVLSGGAPIAPDVVRRIVAAFGCDYAQTYGMTETSPYLTISTLKANLRALPAAQRLAFQAKTGRPFLTVELDVVDDDGKPVPADERTVGEIRVRGPTVTPGYWKRPDATAAAFDADGFLRTGDLAVVDAEGYVTIVERKKDMIITGGENVYSVEVENVLYRHPAVLEAAVFGATDPVWGEQVRAAVALRPGAQASEAELIAHCRQHLAGFKVPRAVQFAAALPRTGSGKIAKRALRDLASPRR